MKFRTILAACCLSLGIWHTAVPAAPTLQEKIAATIEGHQAAVGVVIENADATDTAAIAPNDAFPMQSVYKFPIALAVLDRVEKGELALTQRITVRRDELRPGTWSPLRDKYPVGKTVRIPLAEIVRTTISESDNNGCDILLKLAGGPEKVTAWLRQHGIDGMTVATTERAMHGDWHIQYKNRTTPKAATELLRLFHEKKLPGPATYPLLHDAMKNAMLAPERLRSGLPDGADLIHKTGTSLAFYQKQGMTLNDIGIILPDGKPVYISVFVYRCKEPRARAEKMIAAIARTTWEHFTTPPVPDHTPDVPPAAMTVHQPSAPANGTTPNGTTPPPPDTAHRPGDTRQKPAP